MTLFSSTASPGQRWKMFLPGAASIQHDILGVSTASALIRSRWLSAITESGSRITSTCVATAGLQLKKDINSLSLGYPTERTRP